MNATETKLIEEIRRNAITVAFFELFDRLKSYVTAWPVDLAADFPDHSIVFLSALGSEDDATTVIRQAIAEHPALWAHALPKECLIIRKDDLSKLLTLGMQPQSGADLYGARGAIVVEHNASEARSRRIWKERGKKSLMGESDNSEKTVQHHPV